MTSYSRVFYEPYDIDTLDAVGDPMSYDDALMVALEHSGDCSVRFHHAERVTHRRSGSPLRSDFFDDEISRAIRTVEEVGPA